MDNYNTPINTSAWQVPNYEIIFKQVTKPWCIVIPVINEGQRLHQLLAEMQKLQISDEADIIIIDGGSTDGSLDIEKLTSYYVATLLIKTGSGKLSAQLRCAYAFAMEHGYQGVITIDGNNKDCPSAIPAFINALMTGVDFVQGSRFIAGGDGINTPKIRHFAVKYLHAPFLSYCSGYPWTDTTQGFRAYSRKLLLDNRIAVFRDIFQHYELLAHLSYCCPKLGFNCQELPTIRRYPKGKVPTKISAIRGNFDLLKTLLKAGSGRYSRD